MTTVNRSSSGPVPIGAVSPAPWVNDLQRAIKDNVLKKTEVGSLIAPYLSQLDVNPEFRAVLEGLLTRTNLHFGPGAKQALVELLGPQLSGPTVSKAPWLADLDKAISDRRLTESEFNERIAPYATLLDSNPEYVKKLGSLMNDRHLSIDPRARTLLRAMLGPQT